MSGVTGKDVIKISYGGRSQKYMDDYELR